MEKTKIQEQIEKVVTNRRGYEPRTHQMFLPKYLRETDFELQAALANMDYLDGKLTYTRIREYNGAIRKIEILKKGAFLPEGVSTPDGLKTALEDMDHILLHMRS